MIYRKFSPDNILSPFVECYYIWESEEFLNAELVVESPPTGFCSIVFNCGDSYFLQNKKYDRLAVPRHFIAGQSIYSYRLFLNGIISIAGIVLKPTALSTLFNLPVYEYTEERIGLGRVFDRKLIDELFDKLIHSSNITDKVKLLEAFVLAEFNVRKPQTDFVDYAANLILEKNGLLHLNELMENVYMSKRSFERHFFRKVGFSPKYYARIRRMSYLMNRIAGKKQVDWHEAFLECEFYDQSHFIKDFMEFTGRTPVQYLQENKELANILEKPKLESIS
jgi:AraC-like DNA-binding protein